MTCHCHLGLERCDCGLVDEPIPTEPADLEDEQRSTQGMVAALGWAVCVVCAAAVFVMVFVRSGT